MTEKKKKTKNTKGFISHIPASIDELSIALLQPNYNRFRELEKQGKKKDKKNEDK